MARTYKVSLLIETSREYGRGLLRGIYRYNSLHRQWQIEQQAPFYVAGGPVAETQLGRFASRVDGIIMRDRQGSLGLLKKGVPLIFASYLHKEIPDTYRIVADDLAIATLAADHLLNRGFRHFAFVGYDTMYWSRRRKDGFAKAVGAAGFGCEVFVQSRGPGRRLWRWEQKALAEWLAALPKPTGLLACNDDRARQVVDACLTAGLSVPEEIAIVGADNDEFVCNLSNPPISSVALNVEEAGFEAARLLDDLMRGGRPQPRDIIPATLGVVTRRSTEVTAIQDPTVAEAVRFIRANGRKPLQVSDVVEAAAVSRRGLYDRFRRALGCSVHEYIKKARVAEIERLLLDTETPVSEIAELLGFPSADHIASYFRSVRGVNPLTLRRQGGQ